MRNDTTATVFNCSTPKQMWGNSTAHLLSISCILSLVVVLVGSSPETMSIIPERLFMAPDKTWPSLGCPVSTRAQLLQLCLGHHASLTKSLFRIILFFLVPCTTLPCVIGMQGCTSPYLDVPNSGKWELEGRRSSFLYIYPRFFFPLKVEVKPFAGYLGLRTKVGTKSE